MVMICTLFMIVGIILLIGGVGSSIRFKIAGFIIPGSVGMMLIALGILLSIVGRC